METQNTDPAPGVILIAHPWLPDPNFARTTILLCDHQPHEGSFGLVLSRPLDTQLGDVVNNLSSSSLPLFAGGPVQPNTLHYVHKHGSLIDSSIPLQQELYWGGDFDLVQALVLAGETAPESIRFFAGYSGWGPGQLDAEIEEGSWILTTAPTSVILESDGRELWRILLKRMGGPYALMANFPTDPRNN